MAFCLHPEAVDAFRNAIRNGDLDPDELINMTSEERRARLGGIIGEENAPDVNALLESKLLQKNQIHGLTQWAKQVAGLKPEARRDLLSRIQRIDHLLTPDEQRDFLEDHVRQRLGVRVTPDQAAKISELGRAATQAEAAMKADPARNPFRRGSDETPESEKAYGHAYINLTDYVDSLKPDNRSLLEKFSDVANIPRTILTLGHLSAPFVQGWGTLATRQAAQALMKQLHWAVSERGYREMMAGMVGHPLYNTLTKGGLVVTNLTKNLNQREEAIQSSLVEWFNEAVKQAAAKAGVPVPNIARAGSRAFTGYQNYIRFYRAVDLAKAAQMKGYDISPGSKAIEDIATMVNNFSGRGSIGKEFEKAAPLANAIFFAPRKILGTIQMFNPQTFLDPRITSTARIGAVKQLAGSLIATGAILGLATQLGFPVNMNPIDTKFAKIQLPNGAMIDVTGGNAVYLRLISRLLLNREVTAKGRELELGPGHQDTRASLIGKFLRNKLAPTAALIMDAAVQQDPVGNPITVQSELHDKAMPIALQSFINFAGAIPENYASLVFSPLIAFGAGVEPPFVAPPRHRFIASTRHG